MENPQELNEILKKFVECGADLSDESTTERSTVGLLAKASNKKGNLDNLKYLIENHNFDPSGGPHSKKSPLINACSNGDIEAIQYLVSKKANPNSVVKGIGYMEGVSCLQAAIASKSFDIQELKQKAIKLLLEAGAEISEKVFFSFFFIFSFSIN